nr:filamentous hemagglutinin N-terminal domain-containing protein [Nitrospirota bacterium]
MRTKAFFLTSIILIGGALSSISYGQVTTNITSSGLGTAVSPISSGVVTITGGTRPGNGPNLFHSFGLFNVGAGDTANFFNNTGLPTTNILSRVTGGNPSNIFGTIQTTGFGNANLFLINPAGVVFGPSASLNIGGSFHVSTADYLRLSDGVRFNAVPDVAQDALLSTAPVAAFGFLDPNPAAIAIQGSTLQVPDGQTLSIVGGNVTIQGGTLSAPGGQINLASVASPGEILLPDLQTAPNVNGESFTSLGQVQLVNDPAPVLEGTLFTAGSLTNLDGTYHITLLEIGNTGKLEAVIPLAGPDYTIPGDKGKFGGDLGANWFLTFSRFDLIGGETATFQSPGITINNILSRVIGGQPSVIDGTLNWFANTDLTVVNLYFLNPAGVSFLANAQLGTDVTGSFHVSTADYLRLGTSGGTGSGIFYADATQLSNTLLTSESPTAFGFTNSHPAPISIEGSVLMVPTGQSISLIGGDITMTGGSLTAPSGQINLVSVASPGEILIPSMQTATNINGDPVTALGTINLSEGALIDVSTLHDVDFNPLSDTGNGTVLVKGGRLIMDTASIQAINLGIMDGASLAIDIDVQGDMALNNSSLQAVTIDAAGGSISVRAGTLTMTDSTILTDSIGGGNTGKVTIATTNALSLTNSLIQVVAESAGNAGVTDIATGSISAIDISAGSVSIDRGTIESRAFDIGNAGDLTLHIGNNLSITNGGIIDSISGNVGLAGNIMITAGETVSIAGQVDPVTRSSIINRGSFSGSGNIEITGKNFLLADGARIESSSLTQPGGNITIRADESVTVSGIGTRVLMEIRDASGGVVDIAAPTINIDRASVRARTAGIGDAGVINLKGNNITILNGQVTTAAQESGSGGNVTVIATGHLSISGQFTDEFGVTSHGGIFASTVHGGQAGQVNVSAGAVAISDGARIDSSASGSGLGGDITVQASQVGLSSGATIAASSTGTGNAGNITVTATDSLVMQNGSISTATTQSDGGNITLQVGRLVQLTDSQITTSVQGGLGNGGNITIDPLFVIVQGSQVLANAFGGNGGNILIVAGVFLVDPTSTISASSTFGVSGTVQVQTTVSNLSESVAPLSGEFVHTPELLQARCAARFQGGQYSSFVVAGRDGLPLEPGGLLPSPLVVERQGSPKLAQALDVPGLRFGRALEGTSLVLAPLEMGCAS